MAGEEYMLYQSTFTLVILILRSTEVNVQNNHIEFSTVILVANEQWAPNQNHGDCEILQKMKVAGLKKDKSSNYISKRKEGKRIIHQA